MPRKASTVSLRCDPTTLSLPDASDRFARASMILMQIAARSNLNIDSQSMLTTGNNCAATGSFITTSRAGTAQARAV